MSNPTPVSTKTVSVTHSTSIPSQEFTFVCLFSLIAIALISFPYYKKSISKKTQMSVLEDLGNLIPNPDVELLEQVMLLFKGKAFENHDDSLFIKCAFVPISKKESWINAMIKDPGVIQFGLAKEIEPFKYADRMLSISKSFIVGANSQINGSLLAMKTIREAQQTEDTVVILMCAFAMSKDLPMFKKWWHRIFGHTNADVENLTRELSSGDQQKLIRNFIDHQLKLAVSNEIKLIETF